MAARQKRVRLAQCQRGSCASTRDAGELPRQASGHPCWLQGIARETCGHCVGSWNSRGARVSIKQDQEATAYTSYSRAIVSRSFRFIAVTSRMLPLYMDSSQSFNPSSHCFTATLQPSGPRGSFGMAVPGMGGGRGCWDFRVCLPLARGIWDCVTVDGRDEDVECPAGGVMHVFARQGAF